MKCDSKMTKTKQQRQPPTHTHKHTHDSCLLTANKIEETNAMEPSNHNHETHQQRLLPKQADAIERRRRMTQRRQEQTQRIRKQKKSAYLDRKRQLTTTATTTTTSPGTNTSTRRIGQKYDFAMFRNLFHTMNSLFPQRNQDQDHQDDPVIVAVGTQLQHLQMGLTAALTERRKLADNLDNNDHPLVVLTSSDEDEKLAKTFLEHLLEFSKRLHGVDCSMKQSQDQTLTTEFTLDANEVEQQRQQQQQQVKTTMLKLLVDLSSISRSSSSITSTESSSFSYYGRVPLTWSELIVMAKTTSCPPSSSSWLQRLCLILMDEVRSSNCHDSNSISVAYMCCLVVGNVVGEGPTTVQHISPETKVEMVRTLITAISYSLQHQQQVYQQGQDQQQQQQLLIAPAAAWSLTNLIRNDVSSFASLYLNDQLLSTTILQSWLCRYPSIGTQAAWMVASLTSKEEETARYLATTGLVSSLLGCLVRPVAADQQIPVVQALGHLASHSSIVPGLLTTPSSTPVDQNSQSSSTDLVSVLQQMIANLPAGDPRLIPVVWLTGCLLVDTGMPNGHPSTTLAGPTLVPVVMSRLGGERNNHTGLRELKLDEERELACALWNAFDQPPDLHGEWSTDQQFMLAMPKSTLQVLVKLMKSSDDDAVLASVHVLDLYLRRVGGTTVESLNSFQDFMRTLEEEDAVHALEAVCDSHVEDAADVAADLIDDFFAEMYENDDCNNDDQWNPGIDVSYPTENAFANLGTGGTSFGVFPATASFAAEDRPRAANGMCRGRGRGATLPSWMSK